MLRVYALENRNLTISSLNILTIEETNKEHPFELYRIEKFFISGYLGSNVNMKLEKKYTTFFS